MRKIDLSDLSFAAELKSDLMYLLWNMENERNPSLQPFTDELRSIIREYVEFESTLQESLITESNY